jgi:AraC-like DNA-binding protein
MTSFVEPPSSHRRAGAACKNATELRPKPFRARGLLRMPSGVENGRVSPSSDLETFIEHYWWVRWVVSEPCVSELLSYPSVHVVFEGDGARITGVVRGRFSRRLEGRGAVFGVKFHPGMFRQFCRRPVSDLTDEVLPLAGELGKPARSLARALWGAATELERAACIEASLRTVLPAPDPDAVLARDLVARVRVDSTLRSVAGLAAAGAIAPRTLQRLFREYVGVGPKWVVRRFRLQEAAELLATTRETVASVAARLGYFDQAHFVRDFKTVVGVTPVEFKRKTRARGLGQR